MQAYWDANVPLKRIGQPTEIADAMRWLASDCGSYVTGKRSPFDGGHTIKMTSDGV